MKDHNLYTIIPHRERLLKFSEAKSARAYFKNHYIDLLTGQTHPFEIEGWLSELDFKVINQPFSKRVIHLFYELGFIFEAMAEEVDSLHMLALDIEYEHYEYFHLPESSRKINLSLIDAPHFHEYEKQFHAGYAELKKGNCYQFNLTGEYRYAIDDDADPEDFLAALWRDKNKRGAYASATYSTFLQKMFLSNSPECLFQYHGGELLTRPIKGTMKIKEGDNVSELWRTLITDKKSEGELNMITDLLRNDLSRIDLPRAIVTKKKAPLLVPGLVHQYSEVKIKLRPHITLKNILEKIFPGGSITGAPKKRVMKILIDIEKRARGFYCGSTVIFSPQKIEASINIRSSEIDFKNCVLSYQAGGGITLMSSAESEFLEMTYKHDSFVDILTL